MPITFVLMIIALVIAVIAALVWATVKSDEDVQLGAFMVGTIAAIFAVVFFVIASSNIVGTRQVGVVTSFNKPTGETLSNGYHWLAPWKKVSEFDAAIQNDVYNGHSRIQVRLGNNSTALADVNIRWNIKQDAADELFVQYKDFANVRSNLIERNLRTALNTAFLKFDPLAGDPKPGDPPNATLSTVTNDVLLQMRELSGNQVDILDLSIPVIDYDDNTEQRINAINAARAETTKAEQDAKTAEQRRKAAEVLAGQPVPDLKIAIAACVNRMAETGQSLNCFPIGTNVVGTLNIPNPAG